MPDTSTEVAIATTTLGSAGSITFSSIPSTYTDLRLVMVGKISSSDGIKIRFNNNSSTVYSDTYIRGTGTAADSARTTNGTEIDIGFIYSTNPSLTTVDVFSYANTNINKTFLAGGYTDDNGSGYVWQRVGLWRSTSAINRIDLLFGPFATGTTATLYGIL
jgi:hypothetical protein